MERYEKARNFIIHVRSTPNISTIDVDWAAIDELWELVQKATPVSPLGSKVCPKCFTRATEKVPNLIGIEDENGQKPEYVHYPVDHCFRCGQRLKWDEFNEELEDDK